MPTKLRPPAGKFTLVRPWVMYVPMHTCCRWAAVTQTQQAVFHATGRRWSSALDAGPARRRIWAVACFAESRVLIEEASC